MASSNVNSSEDTEINDECDGDKVVTMMDVLQEQQDFEEDANAVLGASDDKNCTYSKGYVKRQAIYACLTCCSDARFDPTKRAGVCLACSLTCHENHELIELYTRRNFCCDCGNSKFSSNPCQFTNDKTGLNEENVYNQNFSGLYCTCHRPYPDPDGFEDEMIQCIICEDWLHAQHLEAAVPSQDQNAEMICKDCMDKNEFLHDYSELAVNNEEDNIDVVNNSINDVSMNGCMIEIKVNGCDESKELENKDDTQQKEDSRLNDIVMEETTNETNLALENETAKTDDHKEKPINEQINEEKTTLETKQDPPIETENKTDEDNEKAVENKEIDQATSEEPNMEAKIPENETKADNVIDDIDKFLAGDDDESKKEEDKPILEQQDDNLVQNDQTDTQTPLIENTNIEEENNLEEEQNKVDESKEETPSETTADVDNKDAENMTNGDITSTDNLNDTVNEQGEKDNSSDIKVKEGDSENLTNTQIKDNEIVTDTQVKGGENAIVTDAQVKEQEDNLETNDKQEETRTESQDNEDKNNIEENKETLELNTNKNQDIDTEKQDSVEDDLDDKIGENTQAEMSISDETQSTPIDQTEKSEQIEEESPENGLMSNGHTKTIEHKRKLSTENSEHNEVITKKSKFDFCSRPKSKKKIFKGATFWPHNFRQKLCTCSECMTMYKDLSVLFLTDLEDTVAAYETLGKQNGTATQYERGMEALSSLGRIQQINALTEYNKMRDKLVDFLRSFKDRREVVKEEDIKAFFAGMKPTREPDGVYFCR